MTCNMAWCPHNFPRDEKNSTLSSVGSPHKASQSGHGGGQRTISHASSPNQGGRCGSDLCDGSAAVDGRSEKVHAAERVGSTPLKIELIPGSHGKFNLLVMKVILLRILEWHIRRVSHWLTALRRNLSEWKNLSEWIITITTFLNANSYKILYELTANL